MISASTFAFALALVVGVNAAAVWITWWRLTRALALSQSANQQQWRTLAANARATTQTISALKQKAPESLAAEVADLREAVARLRATFQRFQGRYDATRPAPRTFDGETGEPIEDDELAAMVALQTAPPVKPTNGSV